MEKKYGLIKSSEAKAAALSRPVANFSRPSVFDEESSDEDLAPRKIGLQGEAQKRQAKLIQDKAMEEDPTIYQYDEVYDEISNKRQEEKAKKSEDKKPKYIQRLLQTAEKRKIENERRIERQVQREREAEGEMFKDKEAFVTASYRKKLEELKKAEEEEAREAYLESIGDVKKQGNLDGFYRHIYSQKLDRAEPKPKPDILKVQPSSSLVEEHDDGSSEENASDPVLSNVSLPSKKDTEKGAKSRSYRKRNSSKQDESDKSSEDEETAASGKKEHLPSNLDADSDFSIDSSSSDEDEETTASKENTTKVPESIDLAPPEFVRPKSPDQKLNTNDLDSKLKSVSSEAPLKNGHETSEKLVTEPPKPKIDIWKKRTVGDVFDAALQRYYERKAQRQQMVR